MAEMSYSQASHTVIVDNLEVCGDYLGTLSEVSAMLHAVGAADIEGMHERNIATYMEEKDMSRPMMFENILFSDGTKTYAVHWFPSVKKLSGVATKVIGYIDDLPDNILNYID